MTYSTNVTKMLCINPNSAEFKEALKRAGGNPLLAEAEINGKLSLTEKIDPAKDLEVLSSKDIKDLQNTMEQRLLVEQDDTLSIKGGQQYVYLQGGDAERFAFLLDKEKEFPKEFTVSKRITKYEKGSEVGKFKPYQIFVDLLYKKSNNNKRSNLYDVIDSSTGEVLATKVRLLHTVKNVKDEIASKYGFNITPTKVFSAARSIGFALYRQKPSKAKYVAMAKKYLYDAIKFLNPEGINLKINLNKIEEMLSAFPEQMWDYINTTYSPEDTVAINAAISLKNNIQFNLPKLGLLRTIQDITGIPLEGVTFKNYDRTGGIEKIVKVGWGQEVTIDPAKLTKKQLKKAISYYLQTKEYFKPTSEELNVRKYAEHTGADYEELKKLVFGDFDEALKNIVYNQTGNSDNIELSKWRESVRNYDWQSVELFEKPITAYLEKVKEKITEKFKDKTLSNGISHLDYFFSGNFNWLNINFNNISGSYYTKDEELSPVGVDYKMAGFSNPFMMALYSKPSTEGDFLKEEEVFNRLAAILHEPFHALHALSYGTKQELELREAFNNLFQTSFGRQMMEEIFGEGYNQGQQISFDVLYKEFTAFTSQLMLYPKEWVTKTSLRSNDIYDFILKIQSLQDKTYEEIVRTKKKIGTEETTEMVEEQIKLTFLEKLYNYITSALRRVIPLSRKFMNLIESSKLVEKKIVKDLFGEEEETVTRVLKLPEAVRREKEIFLQRMDELKSAINTLLQVDGSMFSSDNVTSFFSKEDSFSQETGRAEPTQEEVKQEETQEEKELLNKVKNILSKMGVKIEDLVTYAKRTGLDARNVNAIADLFQRVVAVAEGQEDAVLTEEMVHIAMAILEQSNPKLMSSILSKIGNFAVYQRVLKEYSGRKEYQLADGRPDIRKIKMEAAAQLMTELIVNNGEDAASFPELSVAENRSTLRKAWDAVMQFFSNSYKQSGIELFKRVSSDIISGKYTDINVIKDQGVFFNLSPRQEAFNKRLEETKKILSKEEGAAEQVTGLEDEEEVTNWYNVLTPTGTVRRVKKRVTDRVKALYREMFPIKREFSPTEKKVNEVKRNYGINGHKDFENIVKRYYNADGTRKQDPDPMPPIEDINTTKEVYVELEKYFVELVNQLSVDPKTGAIKNLAVYTEVMLYDAKEDEAGTIDLLMVDDEGAAHIYDWKFYGVSPQEEDIPWFKQEAYDLQLGRYREILRTQYGIKKFLNTRAVPILISVLKERTSDDFFISSVKIGSLDTKNVETDLRVVPYSQQEESTGEEALDNVLQNLADIKSSIRAEVKKGGAEEVIRAKRESISLINKAMRMIHAYQDVTQLFDIIGALSIEGQAIINSYESIKDKPFSSDELDNKTLSKLAYDIRVFLARTETLSGVDEAVGELIYNKKMEDKATTPEEKEDLEFRKQEAERLRALAFDMRRSREKIQKISNAFADRFIGERNGVVGLTKPEVVLKGLSSLYEGAEQLGSAAITALTKITEAAQQKAKDAALEKVKRVMAIRDRIIKSKGDVKSYVKQIFQYTPEGQFMNKLIYQYKKEFYDELDAAAIKGESKTWLKENVDLDAYRVEAKEVMERRLKILQNNPYYTPNPSDTEEILKYKAKNKEKAELAIRRDLDIDREDFIGWKNYILKRHPLSKWYSDAYKKILLEGGPALELYNFIRELNAYAEETGYIHAVVAKTFFPFIRKDFAENFKLSGSVSAINNYFASLQARADDTGMGSINPITKELENSLPRYYIHDFTRQEEGKPNDYSEVSEEVFKNLILYIQQVEKYAYMDEVENQINIIGDVEKAKGHLATTRTGSVVMTKKGPKIDKTNEENTKIFNDFKRAIFYGQKYTSDADSKLYVDKAVNAFKRAVNRMMKKEVFKESDKDTYTSTVKTIETLNKAVSVKLLGLVPMAGAINWFGANLQVMAQSGLYFSTSEFVNNEKKLWRALFGIDKDELLVNLIDTFMPLTEDPSYERYKEAGMSFWTKRNLMDDVMVFMRKPEQLVEKAIFMSILDNTMVENGKVVNIQKFVKNKYKGQRFASAEDAKKYDKIIDDEIKELKSKRALSKIAKMEEGSLVIPGLDINKDKAEIRRVSSLARRLNSRATGKITETNRNRASMNIWLRSLMVFKTWIPPLALTRFQELRKISDDFSTVISHDPETGDTVVEGENYDIGRIRLYAYVLGTSIRDKTTNIINILRLNEAGLKSLDELYDRYKEDYFNRTGEELNMSKDDFIDMVRTNLRNQTRELRLLLFLMSLLFSMGFIAPDDDEDKATKNAFNYTRRMIDKFSDEIAFFYNPTSLESILAGGMPAVSMFSDGWRFIKHFILQLTGFDLTDPSKTAEQVREDAMPIKYMAKMLPVTRSFLTYMAIFSDEFAREFEVTIQKESTPMR